MRLLKKEQFITPFLAALIIGLAPGCGGDDDPDPVDPVEEEELITTVTLTFTSGSETVTASWRDIDGEGGDDPVITNPTLTASTTYDLSVSLLNETEDPAENVTMEIEEEAEEHQFFYQVTGDVLSVTITDVESDYVANMEGEDLPVGLAASVVTSTTGSASLNVVLKHLPPVNDAPQKTGTNTVNDGESDIDVSFDITVQ